MPVRLTRQTVEAIGINPGSVTAFPASTIYVPLLEPDWSSRLNVTTEWQTAISRSPFTGTEERHSIKARPTRSIDFTTTSMSQEDSMRIQMSVNRMMSYSVPFPLYSDVTYLDRAEGAGSEELSCSTLHRRFFKGQRVVIVDRQYKRRNYGVEAYGLYGEIKEVAMDKIILSAPLGFALDGSELVYPCIDIEPILSQNMNLFTDHYAQARVEVFEKDGANTLPPTWLGEIEAYFDYYQGYPIFKVEPNYATRVKQDFYRPGQRFRSGRTTTVELFSDLPSISLKYSEFNTSRKEAWDLLRFFDSRMGATKPFWLIQPLSNWETVAISPTSIQVRNYDYLDSLDTYISHVGIEGDDGTLHIKEIESTSNPAGRFNLNFPSDPFVITPTVARAAPAWLCRFDNDSLEQKWETDHYETTGVEILGLRNEQASVLTTA